MQNKKGQESRAVCELYFSWKWFVSRIIKICFKVLLHVIRVFSYMYSAIIVHLECFLFLSTEQTFFPWCRCVSKQFYQSPQMINNFKLLYKIWILQCKNKSATKLCQHNFYKACVGACYVQWYVGVNRCCMLSCHL